MKTLLSILLLLQIQALFGMGCYKPGDTLYVWAISGLTLRESPSLNGAKLANVPYGTMLKVLNYNGDHQTSVVALPGYITGEKPSPALELSGDFAAVTFQGIKGYLFDGYLSTLPPFTFSKTSKSRTPIFEGHVEWATRNFGLLQKSQTGTFAYGTSYTAQWIFGNGILINSETEKEAKLRLILPDISLEEAFLVFNCMEIYEWKILNHDQSDPEGYRFEKTGLDAWVFYTANCENTIRYLPHEKIAIITSHCSC